MTVGVDSNIFIYWLEGAGQLHDAAKEFLSDAVKNEYELVCSTLVIAEILSKPGASIEALNRLPILWVVFDKAVAKKVAGLRRANKKIETPDAIHLASAMSVGASRFITNDQVILKLKKVEGLAIVSLA